jgi:hypothetical protein
MERLQSSSLQRIESLSADRGGKIFAGSVTNNYGYQGEAFDIFQQLGLVADRNDVQRCRESMVLTPAI